MPVAAIVAARDVGELAHLHRSQRTVRDRDAQHIGVKLQVDAVHQPMQFELVFGQVAGEASRRLVAELRDPLGYELGVELVIPIHGRPPARRVERSRAW